MKRVRLAGAAAVAPVLAAGFAAPAALAAPSHPSHDRSASAHGKSVRLPAAQQHAAPAAAFCSYHVDHRATMDLGASGYAEISYNGGLLCSTSVHLLGTHRNLEMRTRVYAGPGAKNGIASNLQHGGVRAGSTYFSHWFSSLTGGKVACVAVVNSKNRNSVKYGPVCFNY
jgi:hypothetical protein